MYLYKTVKDYGEAEIVIEKSRFIARVMPVNSYEEAQAFVNEIKQANKQATHNVPAIVVGSKQEMQWASDDGEPSGTSGLPMLKMITDEGLTNTAIVVTRFFGGIKLGTGGLSRAYTSIAKLGIQSAGIVEVHEGVELTYRIDYSFLPRIQNASRNNLFHIDDTVYTDVVELRLSCMSENEEEVEAQIQNLCNGQSNLVSKKNILNKLDI